MVSVVVQKAGVALCQRLLEPEGRVVPSGLQLPRLTQLLSRSWGTHSHMLQMFLFIYLQYKDDCYRTAVKVGLIPIISDICCAHLQ